jgi:hypothetical protein
MHSPVRSPLTQTDEHGIQNWENLEHSLKSFPLLKALLYQNSIKSKSISNYSVQFIIVFPEGPKRKTLQGKVMFVKKLRAMSQVTCCFLGMQQDSSQMTRYLPSGHLHSSEKDKKWKSYWHQWMSSKCQLDPVIGGAFSSNKSLKSLAYWVCQLLKERCLTLQVTMVSCTPLKVLSVLSYIFWQCIVGCILTKYYCFLGKLSTVPLCNGSLYPW